MNSETHGMIINEEDWGLMIKEAFFCVHEIERLLKSVTAKLSHGAGGGISLGEENGP